MHMYFLGACLQFRSFTVKSLDNMHSTLLFAFASKFWLCRKLTTTFVTCSFTSARISVLCNRSITLTYKFYFQIIKVSLYANPSIFVCKLPFRFLFADLLALVFRTP